MVYCKIDLSSNDRLNQHCVNSFDKDLMVMDVGGFNILGINRVELSHIKETESMMYQEISGSCQNWVGVIWS